MNVSNSEEASETPENEYDSQIAHTIWELERVVRKGRASDATRRVLVESHIRQLQMIEERAGVEPESRSSLLLQSRPGPSLLLLTGEEQGCESVSTVARFFHRAGFSVLSSSLSYRTLNTQGFSPIYWQTCLDEAKNRYQMLGHYSTRTSLLGVGLAGALGLELASEVRLHCLIALFPSFHADVALGDRLKNLLRRMAPPLVKSRPNWQLQRDFLTSGARKKARKSTLPIFVVAKDLKDKSEDGRSARFARSLEKHAATVRFVAEARATPSALPEALLEEITKFARQS